MGCKSLQAGNWLSALGVRRSAKRQFRDAAMIDVYETEIRSGEVYVKPKQTKKPQAV
jgi:hypothetical protein